MSSATPTFTLTNSGNSYRVSNVSEPIHVQFERIKKLLEQTQEKMQDLQKKGLEQVPPKRIRPGDVLYVDFLRGPESKIRYWRVTMAKAVKKGPYHYEFTLRQKNGAGNCTVKLEAYPGQYVVRKKDKI